MAGLTRLVSNSLKRASADSAVLFICDVQEVFRPVIHNMPAVIHNTEYLNSVCHLLNVPAVITEHYAKAFGKTVSEITAHPTTKVIQKTQFSMMVPELRAELPPTRKQIILCGIETHVCVQQTTLDLLREEYDVFVVCDAVSSQRPYDRTVALNRLGAAGAILTTAESLIFDLMKDAKHPNFKQISGLIKRQKDTPGANLFDHQTTL
eukprot:gene10501-11432_t